MNLTRKHRLKARLLWQSVLVNGVPDPKLITEAVKAVGPHEGRDAEAVLECFRQRLKVYIRANRIRVVSADSLSESQKAHLLGSFRGTSGETAGISFSVDAAVIGGLSVEHGYQVADRTIARQLEILRDRLLAS
jgi:F0F1-type ATP synthase delta subunit